MDGEPLAAGLARKVGIFRKLLIQFRLGWRDLASRERDAIGKPDHALGHGAQVVRHIRAEGDGAERRPAFRLVLALPVMLEDELASVTDQKRVQSAHFAVPLSLRKALSHGFGWRSRKGARRRDQAGPQPGQDVPAMKAGRQDWRHQWFAHFALLSGGCGRHRSRVLYITRYHVMQGTCCSTIAGMPVSLKLWPVLLPGAPDRQAHGTVHCSAQIFSCNASLMSAKSL